jgi:hypothetical protein
MDSGSGGFVCMNVVRETELDCFSSIRRWNAFGEYTPIAEQSSIVVGYSEWTDRLRQ